MDFASYCGSISTPPRLASVHQKPHAGQKHMQGDCYIFDTKCDAHILKAKAYELRSLRNLKIYKH
eukprot:1972854-Amphidinium_carterae.1